MITTEELEMAARIVRYHGGTREDREDGLTVLEIKSSSRRHNDLWWCSSDDVFGTFESFLDELHQWSKDQGSNYSY